MNTSIIRILLWASIWLFITIPLQLIGALLLLVVLPIHRHNRLGKFILDKSVSEQLKLPAIVRWFDNADIYNGRDYSTYYNIFNSSFLIHYTWLAFRNPLNYFGYYILGFVSKNYVVLIEESNPGHEVGDMDGPGFFKVVYNVDGHIRFEYYYIFIYPFAKTKCLRIRIGHKMGANLSIGKACQYVFVISPWHSFTGHA